MKNPGNCKMRTVATEMY